MDGVQVGEPEEAGDCFIHGCTAGYCVADGSVDVASELLAKAFPA